MFVVFCSSLSIKKPGAAAAEYSARHTRENTCTSAVEDIFAMSLFF